MPYRNIAQYGPDLIAGTVPLGFQWLPNVNAPLKAGGARPLAVAAKTRMAALPDVPTTAEAGFGTYKTESWFGLITPRGVPKPIIARLNADIVKVLKEEDTRKKILAQGAMPGYGPPEHFAKMQRDEYAELGALIKETNMKVQ